MHLFKFTATSPNVITLNRKNKQTNKHKANAIKWTKQLNLLLDVGLKEEEEEILIPEVTHVWKGNGEAQVFPDDGAL